MLQRKGPYLAHMDSAAAPSASQQLESDGYALLPELLSAPEVGALKEAMTALYSERPRDGRAGEKRSAAEDEDFRYEAFNYSPVAQNVIGHPVLLDTLAPLLGPDCHVIANTCWRNPPRAEHTHGGGVWHRFRPACAASRRYSLG